ncbi:MAG: C-GCAxxG-C-C family protein [Deltaproteobacteria bacterium]|jgi:C_GCAxxG_C_C family probable redox protein|nr:C-GCAxxG-C-C family protein [Deltaproteobacteria bacterium]
MDITDEGYFHLLQLSGQEFSCSQILMQMCLENRGKENPELVRAMGGLVGGLGYSGKLCGALSSGACLLSFYAGKGLPEEVEDSRVNSMIGELVQWFEQEFGTLYGGMDCTDIMEGNPRNRIERCPHIILQINRKVLEILDKNNYDLTTGKLEL